jgi:NADH:ubiquinone oxidoreductase subunit K
MLNEVVYSMVVLLLGVLGIIISRKNIIAMLISVELMLLAANFNFIIGSLYVDDALGFIFSMVTLTIAGVEATLGLSILIVYYRLRGIITTSFMSALKG